MSHPDPDKASELLSQMFGLSKSICMEVLKDNGFDVDKACDDIMTITEMGKSKFNHPEPEQQVEAGPIKQQEEEMKKISEDNQSSEDEEDDKKKKELAEKAKTDREILYSSKAVNPERLDNARKFLEEVKRAEKEKNKPATPKSDDSATAQEGVEENIEVEEIPVNILESAAEVVEKVQKEAKAFLHKSLIGSSKAKAPDDEDEVIVQGRSPERLNVQTHLDSLRIAPEEINGQIPLLQIYHDSSASGTNQLETISSLEAYLLKIGVESDDIKKVDLKDDFELIGYIKAQCEGELVLPVVFLKEHILGTLEELKSYDGTKVKDCIDQVKSGADVVPREILSNKPPAAAPRLGYFDRALEGVETLVSYINPLAWWRGSSPLSSNDPNLFSVIHTNWYGRNLERKFRFIENSFLRIHAKHGDVRAARSYDEVSTVLKKSPTFLIISYANGSSPDWIQAREDDIDKIYQILLERCHAARLTDSSIAPQQ